MVCLSQVATVLASYMLVWWQEDYFGIPIGGYMAAYAGLAIAQALFTFFMGVAFAYITYYASVSLHRSAIARVLRAPSSFYDTTPLGRIQNRLGKDMASSDLSSLVYASSQLANDDTCAGHDRQSTRRRHADARLDSFADSWVRRRVCSAFTSSIADLLPLDSARSIILVAVVSPWFLIAAAAVLVLLYIAASFYRASARELKRIDSILVRAYPVCPPTLLGLFADLSVSVSIAFNSLR
jgi:ABC-type multidrug transport system fused ATPase/permease subunit